MEVANLKDMVRGWFIGAFSPVAHSTPAVEVGFKSYTKGDKEARHFHKIATELYYVLEGEGQIVLDGEERDVRTGTMVHIPPGVVHSAVGQMRVLVVGIPDIEDSDVYYVDQ